MNMAARVLRLLGLGVLIKGALGFSGSGLGARARLGARAGISGSSCSLEGVRSPERASLSRRDALMAAAAGW